MNETANTQDNQNLFSGKKPSISELSKKLVSFDDAPVEAADGVPTSKYLTQIVQKYGSGAASQPAGTPAAAPAAAPIPATQPEAPITQPDTPSAATAAPVQVQPQAAPAVDNQKYRFDQSKNTYDNIIANKDDTDLQARLDVVRKHSTTEEFQRYVDEMNNHSPETIIKQLKGLDMLNQQEYISAKAYRDADNSWFGKQLHDIGKAVSSVAEESSQGAARIKKDLGLPSLQVPEWAQSKEDGALLTLLKEGTNMAGGLVNMATDPGKILNAVNPAQIKRMATGQGYVEGNENLTKATVGALSTVAPELPLGKALGAGGKVVAAPFKAVGELTGISKFMKEITTKNEAAIQSLNANPNKTAIVDAVQQTVEQKAGTLAATTADDFVNTAQQNAAKSLSPIYDNLKKGAEKLQVNPEKFAVQALQDALGKSGIEIVNGELKIKGGGFTNKSGVSLDNIPKVREGLMKIGRQLIEGVSNGKQLLERYIDIKNQLSFPDVDGKPMASNLGKNIEKAIESKFKENGIDISSANKQYAKSMDNIADLAKRTHQALKNADRTTLQKMFGGFQKMFSPEALAKELSTDAVSAAGIEVKTNPSLGSAAGKLANRNLNLSRASAISNANGQENAEQQSGPGSTQQPGKKMSKAEAQAYMKSLGL